MLKLINDLPLHQMENRLTLSPNYPLYTHDRKVKEEKLRIIFLALVMMMIDCNFKIGHDIRSYKLSAF
jgi:hypothetical protein